LAASLKIDPRLGARKGTRQSRATGTITGNRATGGLGAPGGTGGGASRGSAGMPGADGVSGTGVGGGLSRFKNGSVTLANTNINGNNASTTGNDVSFADDLAQM
jgi:hypothetical protein